MHEKVNYDFPNISCVIINYNSGNYIYDCIAALESQTYPNLEIIVVDNCSTDGSSAVLSHYKSTRSYRYFHLNNNKGASFANNYGISKTDSEYVLILNADAFLNKCFIENCILEARKHTRVGTIIGKLVSFADKNVIDSVGIKIYREGFGSDLGYGESDVGQFESTKFVDGACCAAAIYDRNMLNDVKFNDYFFDEKFFAYYEDLDLSYRSTVRGWNTLYVADALGYHVRGGSTQSVSKFVSYLAKRNIIFFILGSYICTSYKDAFLKYIYITYKLLNIDFVKIVVDLSKNYKYLSAKKNAISSCALSIPKFRNSYIFKRVTGVFH